MSEAVTGIELGPDAEKKLERVLQESGFAKRDTDYASRLHDADGGLEQPLLANGDSSERVPPATDADSLSPAEDAIYGINRETEAHTWLPNPKKFEHVLGYDSVAAWLRAKPGRRVIRRDNQFVTNGDRVLVVFPKEELVERDRLLEQAVRDAEYRLTQGDVTDQTPRFRGGPTKEEAFEAHEANKAAGFIQPHGMTHAEMLARLGEKGLAKMEAYYRNGGMTVEVPEDDTRERAEYEERKAAVAERQKTGRKQFAIGASFDRNGKLIKS